MNKNLALQLGLFLIVISLSSGKSFPQSIDKPVESEIIQEYFNGIYKIDPRLISGDFYQPRMSVSAGNPFFINPDWKEGSVILDGVQFDNLLLRYDISTNEIVLNTSNLISLNMQLILKNINISFFKMGDHSFRPFPDRNKFYGSFFCEVLTQGEIDLLLLRSKRLVVMSGGLGEYKYQVNQFEYLFLNENLYRYRGRRTIYRLFPELKAELRDFIKINKLKYRAIKSDDLVNLISHCNILLEEK